MSAVRVIMTTVEVGIGCMRYIAYIKSAELEKVSTEGVRWDCAQLKHIGANRGYAETVDDAIRAFLIGVRAAARKSIVFQEKELSKSKADLAAIESDVERLNA